MAKPTSTSRTTKARAAGARTKKRAKEPVATGARPAFLYMLALVFAVAAGIFAIKTIHATTPALTGFEVAQNQPESTDDPVSNVQVPAAVDLMKTQGWVSPASIEIGKRKRIASELPPEIAAVPEVLIDTEVIRPEGGGYLPPPPIDGSGAIIAGIPAGRSDLAMPQLRDGELTPSGDAVIVQGNELMPGGQLQGQPQTDQIGSMVAGIDRAGRPVQPGTQPQAGQQVQPPQTTRPAANLTLAQVQTAECSRLGFISRIACQDRVRTQFCNGRWNQVAGCKRDDNDEGDF